MIIIRTKPKQRPIKKQKYQPDFTKMTSTEKQKFFDELAEIDSSCIIKKHEEKYR